MAVGVLVVDGTPSGGVLYRREDHAHWLVVSPTPDLTALRYVLDHVLPSELRPSAVDQLKQHRILTPPAVADGTDGDL